VLAVCVIVDGHIAVCQVDQFENMCSHVVDIVHYSAASQSQSACVMHFYFYMLYNAIRSEQYPPQLHDTVYIVSVLLILPR
jgi:hypothetical protein